MRCSASPKPQLMRRSFAPAIAAAARLPKKPVLDEPALFEPAPDDSAFDELDAAEKSLDKDAQPKAAQ